MHNYDNQWGNSTYRIHLYLSELVCLVSLTPVLYRHIPALIQIALFVLWFVASLCICGGKIRSKTGFVIVAVSFIYVVMELSYFVVGISSAAVGNYFKTIKFFAIIIMFLIADTYYDKELKKHLLSAILFFYSINLLYNIYLYITMPNYLNYTGREARVDDGVANVYNTIYSTSVMLFSGVTFFGYLGTKANKRYRRVLLLLFICSTFYVLVCSQRATNYILLIAMILLMAFLKVFNIEKRKSFFGIALLTVLMLPVLIEYILPNVIYYIANNINSARVQKRLYSVYLVLRGSELNNLEGTLDIRYQLMLTSISSFLSNASSFLFGIGNHTYGAVEEAFILGVGGHSQLIDTIAKYGILGGSLVLIILTKTYKVSVSAFKHERWKLMYTIVFICFIVRSFLGNTFEPMVAIPVFLLAPFLQLLFNEDESTEESI